MSTAPHEKADRGAGLVHRPGGDAHRFLERVDTDDPVRLLDFLVEDTDPASNAGTLTLAAVRSASG